MQRGFTLIELAIAVGVLAMVALAGASFALGNRPLAMRQGSVEFSAQPQAAHSLAMASGNGATILVKPRVMSPRPFGFQSTVFSGRPTASNAVTATNFAPVQSGTLPRQLSERRPFRSYLGQRARKYGPEIGP